MFEVTIRIPFYAIKQDAYVILSKETFIRPIIFVS